MGITSEHVVGALALLLGLLGLWLAWRSGRRLADAAGQLRALRRGRRRRLDSLPVGRHVGLRGRVAAIDRIVSPATGREAVYIDRTEEVWDSTPNVIGAAGKWVCTAHSEEAAPFELTDGERSILVDPEGAEVLGPVIRGGEAGTRYTEELIEPGARIVVLGQVTEQGGFIPEGGYRGSPFRRVIAAGRRGLLIATPDRLRRRLAVRLGTHGGLLLGTLTVAVLALLAASNALPVLELELPGQARMTVPPPDALHPDWQRPTLHDPGSPAGPARAEAWTLGWIMGGRPELILERRLEHELWRRQLNWIRRERRTRRRAYLVFDVLRVEGTAHRLPSYWQWYCRTHPPHCAKGHDR